MARHLVFAILTLVVILGLYSGCVMKENFSFSSPTPVPNASKTTGIPAF